MCHNGGGEAFGRRETGPDAPSRRVFTRLLLAGTGLAALAACTPDPAAEPAGTPGPTPGLSPGTGSATQTAAATASTSPLPASPAPATPAPTPTQPKAAPPPPSAAAPGPHHSLTDPASPWVVVNKHRPLSPATFVPPDLARPAVRLATSGEAALLNSTTAAAAEKMFAAAAADGVTITLASGYRSFTTQTAIYGGYAASRGRADAATVDRKSVV